MGSDHEQAQSLQHDLYNEIAEEARHEARIAWLKRYLPALLVLVAALCVAVGARQLYLDQQRTRHEADTEQLYRLLHPEDRTASDADGEAKPLPTSEEAGAAETEPHAVPSTHPVSGLLELTLGHHALEQQREPQAITHYLAASERLAAHDRGLADDALLRAVLIRLASRHQEVRSMEPPLEQWFERLLHSKSSFRVVAHEYYGLYHWQEGRTQDAEKVFETMRGMEDLPDGTLQRVRMYQMMLQGGFPLTSVQRPLSAAARALHPIPYTDHE